eukprot:3438-Pyramimonas_sp.AAC.1
MLTSFGPAPRAPETAPERPDHPYHPRTIPGTISTDRPRAGPRDHPEDLLFHALNTGPPTAVHRVWGTRHDRTTVLTPSSCCILPDHPSSSER